MPTLRSVTALILREMSTRYGRSPGGYLWAVLEPLGALIVMSFAFSLVMRTPQLGTSFILFYATGYIPYSMFLKLSQYVSRSLSFSSSLLVYPVVLWIDAVLARIILNGMTQLLIAYLLLSGIILITGEHVAFQAVPVMQAMGLAALGGIGIGLINCVLGGFFSVWTSLWGIFTRPLFLASGVILLYERLPELAQDILWYNPLMHVTALMREGFYPMYNPQYVSISFCLGVALPLVALGLILVRRFHKEILER